MVVVAIAVGGLLAKRRAVRVDVRTIGEDAILGGKEGGGCFLFVFAFDL